MLVGVICYIQTDNWKKVGAKRMYKIQQAIPNQKKAGGVGYVSDRVNQHRRVPRWAPQQKERAILNLYRPNNIVSKYIKQKPTELRENNT